MDVNFYSDHYIDRVSTSDSYRSSLKVKKKDADFARSISSEYDQAQFSSKAAAEDDDTFAAKVSETLRKSFSTEGASASKVAELKARVQSGTYQVNSQRVAQRLLGYVD